MKKLQLRDIEVGDVVSSKFLKGLFQVLPGTAPETSDIPLLSRTTGQTIYMPPQTPVEIALCETAQERSVPFEQHIEQDRENIFWYDAYRGIMLVAQRLHTNEIEEVIKHYDTDPDLFPRWNENVRKGGPFTDYWMGELCCIEQVFAELREQYY